MTGIVQLRCERTELGTHVGVDESVVVLETLGHDRVEDVPDRGVESQDTGGAREGERFGAASHRRR